MVIGGGGGGAIFTVVSVLIGDLLGSLLDGALELPGLDWFRPVVLLGAMTAFGGAGVLLTKYTGLGTGWVVMLSFLIAFVIGLLVFFAFIKPMVNSKVSSGFSMGELSGRIGEVTIPVPEVGYAEVMIRLGAGKIVRGGGAFILPIFQQSEFISLLTHKLDVTTPEVYTEQGVPFLSV